MVILFRILRSQGGQFWGGFFQGLANQMNQNADRTLREKLVNAQVQHYDLGNKQLQQKLDEYNAQRQAIGDFVQAMQSGVQEPVMEQPLGPPTEQGQMPEPIQTGTRQRALTPQEQLPHLLKIDPDSARDIAKGLIGQMYPRAGVQAEGTIADLVKVWRRGFIEQSGRAPSAEEELAFRNRIQGTNAYAGSAATQQGRTSEQLYGPGQHTYVPPGTSLPSTQTPRPQPQGSSSAARAPLEHPPAPIAPPLPQNRPGNAPNSPVGARSPQGQGESPYMQVEGQKAEIRTSATEQAKRNQPLGDRATNYINPTDLTTAPTNMSEQEAINKGYRAFKGSNGSQFIAMSRSAFNILNRLETLSKELLPEAPKGAGDLERLALAGQTWANLNRRYYTNDPLAVEYFSLLQSNLAQFAKASGDAANIAVPEQEFQKAALPNSRDTQESALQKIHSRQAILRGVIDGALGNKPVPQYGFPRQSSTQAGPETYHYQGKQYIIQNGQVFEVRPK